MELASSFFLPALLSQALCVPSHMLVKKKCAQGPEIRGAHGGSSLVDQVSDVSEGMEGPPRPTVTQMERGWLLSCVQASRCSCGPGRSLHDFILGE